MRSAVLVSRPGCTSNLAAAACSVWLFGCVSHQSGGHGHNAVMTGVIVPVVVACRMIELSYSRQEMLNDVGLVLLVELHVVGLMLPRRGLQSEAKVSACIH